MQPKVNVTILYGPGSSSLGSLNLSTGEVTGVYSPVANSIRIENTQVTVPIRALADGTGYEVPREDLAAAREKAALELRHKASTLLYQSKDLDSMSPFVAIHTHQCGESAFAGWHASSVKPGVAQDLLGIDIEPESGETLAIHDNMGIMDLTGYNTLLVKKAMQSATQPAQDADEEIEDESDSAPAL